MAGVPTCGWPSSRATSKWAWSLWARRWSARPAVRRVRGTTGVVGRGATLDTMQYRTLVWAEVPRVRCAEHGVQQVGVPWADPRSRFTALFEAMVIDWLAVASFEAVARQCRLSWDQVSGIQARAVRRGLSRRAVAASPVVGVDETSFQRRHEYVTVVNDLTASEPRVLYVADGRDRAAIDGYFEAVGEEGCALIEMVAMDMWQAYIGSVQEHTWARRSTRSGGRRTGSCGNKGTTGW